MRFLTAPPCGGADLNFINPKEIEMEVSDKWKAAIANAQFITHYRIGANLYPRIRFGDDGFEGEQCGDCAAPKGQFHVGGCDIERCPRCGGQSISCDCPE